MHIPQSGLSYTVQGRKDRLVSSAHSNSASISADSEAPEGLVITEES